MEPFLRPRLPMHLLPFCLAAASLVSAAACGDNQAAQADAAPGDDATPGEDGTEQADADRYAALEQQVWLEASSLGASGAAAAVIEGGELKWAKGFGFTWWSKDAAAKPTTLFRIASVTKQMTAAAVLRLVDDGLVDLDAPVTQYVPDFHLSDDPVAAASITVRDLLTHASGMPDVLRTDWPDSTDAALSGYLTSDTFRGEVNLIAPPGKLFNYSNPGYMLAGLLVERASGQYYRDYLTQHLFTPLGMSRTFMASSDVVADGDYAAGTQGEQVDIPWLAPCAGVWTSVLDLAKWVVFLLAGNAEVLSDASRAELMAAQVGVHKDWAPIDHDYSPIDIVSYGYGFFVQDAVILDDGYYELPLVAHSGSFGAYRADIVLVPSQRFAFISLANAPSGHLSESIRVALRALVTLPAKQAVPQDPMTTARFPDYVGTWYDPHLLGWFAIRAGASTLELDIPGMAVGTYSSDLACPARDVCKITLPGTGTYPATFTRDGTGNVEYLVTPSYVGKRINADPSLTDGGVPPDSGLHP